MKFRTMNIGTKIGPPLSHTPIKNTMKRVGFSVNVTSRDRRRMERAFTPPLNDSFSDQNDYDDDYQMQYDAFAADDQGSFLPPSGYSRPPDSSSRKSPKRSAAFLESLAGARADVGDQTYSSHSRSRRSVHVTSADPSRGSGRSRSRDDGLGKIRSLLSDVLAKLPTSPPGPFISPIALAHPNHHSTLLRFLRSLHIPTCRLGWMAKRNTLIPLGNCGFLSPSTPIDSHLPPLVSTDW